MTVPITNGDYDAFGRITAFAFAFSDAEDGSSTFSYDATGQLTAADHTAQADESFAYDENGNRTMSGYTTGDNNLLLSDGVFDYVYDNEGNRVSRTRISNDPADDKSIEYTWDHRNRLTRVVFKDNSNDVTKEVIYEYDSFDRRITKIIDADGAGAGDPVQTDLIYDGQDIVLALDGAGEVANRYFHGPAIDMVLADEQVGNELLWTLTDNQGSVRDLVDNSGEVESHIDYTSFGQVDLITDDLVETLYGFTGRERDAETGLNYHRARYYDPVIGRWLSEDPIGFAAGDSNLYRYVFNNSVLYTDPSGLFAQDLEGLINQFAELGKKMMDGAASMPDEVKTMLKDLVQLGLDVGGIFEPTPFCDLTSCGISLWYGELWSAGASGLSVIPYFGDLAKIGKLGKYAKMVTNMAEVLGKHMDVSKVLGPMLKSLDEVLGKGMEMLGDMAPKLRNAVAELQDAIGGTLNKLGIPRGFDLSKGFASFEDFKKAFGPAGSGQAWHHIVEQTINSGRFAAELIHNPANLLRLPHGKGSIHAKISGYYSSKIPGLTGDLTVRQWLSTKSFMEQFEFGVDVIKQFGGAKYLPLYLQ